MTSLCRHLIVTNLNNSTAQEIVNWVTSADGCVHTADATLALFVLGLAKCTVKLTVDQQTFCHDIYSKTKVTYFERGCCMTGFFFVIEGFRYPSLNHASTNPTELTKLALVLFMKCVI